MSLNDITNKTVSYLKNAYNALENKGALLPNIKNLANLADCAFTIQSDPTIIDPNQGVLVNIEFETLPYRLTYQDGDTFEIDGLRVMGRYEDNTLIDITRGCRIIVDNPLTPYSEKFEVQYGDFSIAGNIKVFGKTKEIPSSAKILAHFNGSKKNEINGTDLGTSGSPTYDNGKFGKGLKSTISIGNIRTAHGSAGSPGNCATGTVTYDFWANVKTATSSSSPLILHGYSDNKNGLFIWIGATSIGVQIADQASSTDRTYTNNTLQVNCPNTLNEWHHYAFTFNKGTYSIFMDGILLGRTTFTKGYSNLWGTDTFNIYGGKAYIDELLIAHSILYEDNFTPATGQYGEEEISLQNIYISKRPNKTIYNSGEIVDLNGAVIKASFSDGSVRDVTAECVIENNEPLYRGQYYKIISYTFGTITKKLYMNIGVFVEDDLEAPSNEILDQTYLANYIEATGTQYIDTGIVPKSNLEIEIDLAFSQAGNMGWGSSGAQESFYWGASVKDGFYSSVSPNYTAIIANVPFDTERHIFNLKNGSQKLDGVEFGTGTIGDTAVSGQTIYLCAFHAEWTTTGPDSYNKVKIYSFKTYEDGILTRELVPAYIQTSGEVGLYDKINKKFYENKGTDYFLWG